MRSAGKPARVPAPQPVAVRRVADAPTTVMIASLDGLDIGARPLVVDEASGQLAAALKAMGREPSTWRRYADGRVTAEAWPQATDCTAALVRLGKDRRALAMTFDAVVSVVPAGGAIVLFGANAEGVKSAAKALEAVAENVVTIDTRRHSRVLAGTRRRDIPTLRGALDVWREGHEVALNGRTRPWISYPGVFAAGALDAGTALLLEHLPPIGKGAAVLDMACGTGIIGAVVHERFPDAAVDLVDNDAVAIAAARENVSGVTIICGDGLSTAPRARYDAILSNPPIHDGVDESLAFLEALISEAPSRLKTGGVLQVVIQSRIRVLPLFEAAFNEAVIVAQDRRFQILRGTTGPAKSSRRDER